MKSKRTLSDIEIYIDPRPLTKEDEEAITNYIKADKLKRTKKAAKKINPSKKKAA